VSYVKANKLGGCKIRAAKERVQALKYLSLSLVSYLFLLVAGTWLPQLSTFFFATLIFFFAYYAVFDFLLSARLVFGAKFSASLVLRYVAYFLTNTLLTSGLAMLLGRDYETGEFTLLLASLAFMPFRYWVQAKWVFQK